MLQVVVITIHKGSAFEHLLHLFIHNHTRQFAEHIWSCQWQNINRQNFSLTRQKTESTNHQKTVHQNVVSMSHHAPIANCSCTINNSYYTNEEHGLKDIQNSFYIQYLRWWNYMWHHMICHFSATATVYLFIFNKLELLPLLLQMYFNIVDVHQCFQYFIDEFF